MPSVVIVTLERKNHTRGRLKCLFTLLFSALVDFRENGDKDRTAKY